MQLGARAKLTLHTHLSSLAPSGPLFRAQGHSLNSIALWWQLLDLGDHLPSLNTAPNSYASGVQLVWMIQRRREVKGLGESIPLWDPSGAAEGSLGYGSQ